MAFLIQFEFRVDYLLLFRPVQTFLLETSHPHFNLLLYIRRRLTPQSLGGPGPMTSVVCEEIFRVLATPFLIILDFLEH